MRERKALILTNHLYNFAGSEILSLEVAETLLKMGFEVDLHCNKYSNILVRSANEKINVSDSDNFPNIFEYDFVWSQHCLIPIAIDQHSIPDVWSTQIISAHLSPFEPFELTGLKTAQIIGAEIVANCKETAQRLEGVGVHSKKITNFYAKLVPK